MAALLRFIKSLFSQPTPGEHPDFTGLLFPDRGMRNQTILNSIKSYKWRIHREDFLFPNMAGLIEELLFSSDACLDRKFVTQDTKMASALELVVATILFQNSAYSFEKITDDEIVEIWTRWWYLPEGNPTLRLRTKRMLEA